MDRKTIEAYDQNGEAFCERYRTDQRVSMQRLIRSFEGRRRLLEVGVGSGIDAARLLEAGFDVTGIEPSSLLIDEIQTHFPALKGRILQASLPLGSALLGDFEGTFDAVLCSAVFMHISIENRAPAIQQIAQMMKPGGRLLLTLSPDRGGLNEEHRDEFGRLYVPIVSGEFETYFMDAGFAMIQQWERSDRWNRDGIIWKSFLVEKPTF